MKSFIPVLIIGALGAFGLIYSVLFQPKALFLQLLYMAILVMITYGIFIYLRKKNVLPAGPAHSRSYKSVTKTQVDSLNNVKRKVKKAPKDHPFTVIEGNKEKRKG